MRYFWVSFRSNVKYFTFESWIKLLDHIQMIYCNFFHFLAHNTRSKTQTTNIVHWWQDKSPFGGGKRPNTKQSVLSWKGTILGYPCMHATSPSPKGKTTFLCFKNIYGPPTSLLKSQNVHFMYICNIKVSSCLRAPT